MILKPLQDVITYRMHQPRWAVAPASGAGAAKSGGRARRTASLFDHYRKPCGGWGHQLYFCFRKGYLCFIVHNAESFYVETFEKPSQALMSWPAWRRIPLACMSASGNIESSVSSALILDTMPVKVATRNFKCPKRSLSARPERAYVQAAKGLGSVRRPRTPTPARFG